jgi:hypothetical protein
MDAKVAEKPVMSGFPNLRHVIFVIIFHLPIITYACEASWVLKVTIHNKLTVFERKFEEKFLVLQKKEMVRGESKQTVN